MARSDTVGLTKDEFLGMSMDQRKQVATPALAREFGLVFIDGAGGCVQFVGTRQEHSQRMQGMVGFFKPSVVGRGY